MTLTFPRYIRYVLSYKICNIYFKLNHKNTLVINVTHKMIFSFIMIKPNKNIFLFSCFFLFYYKSVKLKLKWFIFLFSREFHLIKMILNFLNYIQLDLVILSIWNLKTLILYSSSSSGLQYDGNNVRHWYTKRF